MKKHSWIEKTVFHDRDTVNYVINKMNIGSCDVHIACDLTALVYDNATDWMIDRIAIDATSKLCFIEIAPYFLIFMPVSAVLLEGTREIASIAATSVEFRHEHHAERFLECL
ncbi:hypothetical protein [Methylobacterium nodulans]|uniref:hypothetical protein n=1 Tax=Methylobacterium nodulans TaxID=114616 RepID=UPI0012EEA3A5|nr:hypothetical protein [Methylobacterium nodulans]